MFFGKEGRDASLREVMEGLDKRELPIVGEAAGMEMIIDAMIRTGHRRLLYVVDEERKLLGTISLGNLIKHVFSGSHEPQIHPRRLMGAITLETATDMMQKSPVFAEEDEELKAVLERMIKSNVKEIAIVDSEKRVVGDMTILDLLKFLSSEAKAAGPKVK